MKDGWEVYILDEEFMRSIYSRWRTDEKCIVIDKELLPGENSNSLQILGYLSIYAFRRVSIKNTFQIGPD